MVQDSYRYNGRPIESRIIFYGLSNGAIFNDLERPLTQFSRSHALTLNSGYDRRAKGVPWRDHHPVSRDSLLFIYFTNRKRRFISLHYSVYWRTDEFFRLSRSEKKSRSLLLNAFLARFRSLSLSLPGLVCWVNGSAIEVWHHCTGVS